LVPFDGVSVVGGVRVVVVVVSLAESDKGGDDVVFGRVSVVEGLVAEPVGKRVDAEGGVVDKDKSADTSVDESASPVTPTDTGNGSRYEETHDNND